MTSGWQVCGEHVGSEITHKHTHIHSDTQTYRRRRRRLRHLLGARVSSRALGLQFRWWTRAVHASILCRYLFSCETWLVVCGCVRGDVES
jgi:hypothetical protein